MMFQTLTLCCLALVAGIAANTVSTNETDCPLFCAAVYRPVCATDGKIFKEFASACNLKSDNCRRERNSISPYTETDAAWCSSELVDNLHEKLGSFRLDREECFKPCSMIYQPICVTNGKYRAQLSNVCLLETFNCALAAASAQPTELLRVLRDTTC